MYPYPAPALPYRRGGRAAKLTTSVRFGGVGDIQANLVRAEKSQLVGRDGEGASLLMHAAQRGETEVFRVVLDFLADKLSPQEASLGLSFFSPAGLEKLQGCVGWRLRS